jgi:glycogen synthase
LLKQVGFLPSDLTLGTQSTKPEDFGVVMKINGYKVKLHYFLFVFSIIGLIACSTKYSSENGVEGNASQESTELVSIMISNARKFADENRLVVKTSEFNLTRLKNEDLAELFIYLSDYSKDLENRGEQKFIIYKLLFEVRDYIVRLCINDSKTEHFFKSLLVGRDPFIDTLDVFQSEFLTLADSSEKPFNHLENAKIQIENNYSPNHKQKIVFHGSPEAHNMPHGGVSTFIAGLVSAENNDKEYEGYEVTPFYDVLKVELLNSVKFSGYIDHEIDDHVYRSNIYYFEDKDKGYKQFLIQPDITFSGWELFDIGTKASVYSVLTGADRSNNFRAYYGSALATAAALYMGPKDSYKTVTILHLNAAHPLVAPALMNNAYNKMRASAGLPRIGIVSTMHDARETKRTVPASLLSRSGLKTSRKAPILAEAVLHLNSDVSIQVSEAMAKEVVLPSAEISPKITEVFQAIHRSKRLYGIANGIDFELYNPAREDVLGSMHTNSDYSDLRIKKAETKRLLFDAGIIGDPEKPLFLYVGRLTKEKGLDVIESFVTEVVERHSGQVVVMGKKPDKETEPYIEKITAMSRNPKYRGLIKVYTDVLKDQKENLESVKAPKGNLIRFASDGSFFPSRDEPGGLVSMEAFNIGSGPVITSNVQGIQDHCKPFDAKDLNGKIYSIKDFSCITFKRDSDPNKTINSLIVRLHDALQQWDSLSPEEKERAQIRWINDAKTWTWEYQNGSLAQYKTAYEKAFQPKNAEEQEEKSRLIKELIGTPLDGSF